MAILIESGVSRVEDYEWRKYLRYLHAAVVVFVVDVVVVVVVVVDDDIVVLVE